MPQAVHKAEDIESVVSQFVIYFISLISTSFPSFPLSAWFALAVSGLCCFFGVLYMRVCVFVPFLLSMCIL